MWVMSRLVSMIKRTGGDKAGEDTRVPLVLAPDFATMVDTAGQLPAVPYPKAALKSPSALSPNSRL
jgi:hypothetical protein